MSIKAEQFIDGIPINPKLPRNFDVTPNDARPASHQKFWGVPYIQTDTVEDQDAWLRKAKDEYADVRREEWESEGRAKWLELFPSGVRYWVRCLDGGAWDRSTCWGVFNTLEKALEVANIGPDWRARSGR